MLGSESTSIPMSEGQHYKASRLRMIPSVDQLLRTERVLQLRKSMGTRAITGIARQVLAEIRAAASAEGEVEGRAMDDHTPTTLLQEAVRLTEEVCRLDQNSGLKHVINATGVVLHTNLGRAPLSEAARFAIAQIASRYCTLEYDTKIGTRGRRGGRVEYLLQQLTGAEDALVVNNCAAAALLVLSVLAGDGETIVSRGELVEIGGDFRVPDVMASSGTTMVEVGTTNRTNLDDYREAITERTRLLMRVHPSNYRIVGFASSPSIRQLAAISHESKLPLYEDAGSGILNDLTAFGVEDEPPISSLIRDGADVISFSGDKLLGSAQAGLIVGKSEIIQRLRKHPLYRALRSDKLRLAALEATLAAHQRDSASTEIPALSMLALTPKAIESRASRIIEQLSTSGSRLKLKCLAGESAVGGGSAPTSRLATFLIAITDENLSAQEIEERLRRSSPAIIARIADGNVLLDLRTVFPDEEPSIIDALTAISDELSTIVIERLD
jgi:L-seryl-tRNA(Ser) seleniumtransferase